MLSSSAPAKPVKRVLIAVHGIGDQTRNETIQSVVTQYCLHYKFETLHPLGAFYQKSPECAPVSLFDTIEAAKNPDANAVFSEVYWAAIPRGIAGEGYTLQETKAWARSIVDRIRYLPKMDPKAAGKIDYDQIEDVLNELVMAIQVIEALTFLAKKAGIVNFNLRKLLDDYLGDVQIVTEFGPFREQIVATFSDILVAAHAADETAEIYVVAHSEGTVVAWLGLLKAMHADPASVPPWLKQVRGFMTIGSPIDKHLIMWGGLFKDYEKQPVKLAQPIKWRNYVDCGDPIGFELDTARLWMEPFSHYRDNFEFRGTETQAAGKKDEPNDDMFFSRYYVPGKAHNDYWKDTAVFGHFFEDVINNNPKAAKAPKNKGWAQICSYVLAYSIPLALVYAGVYVFYKQLMHYLQQAGVVGQIGARVLLLGGCVAGLILGWRLFRLNRSFGWRLSGVVSFLLGAGLFVGYVDVAKEIPWLQPLRDHLHFLGGCSVAWMLLPASAALLAVAGGQGGDTGDDKNTRPRLSVARGVNGVKLAMCVVGIILLVFAVGDKIVNTTARGPLWPFLLGIAGGVYLCWLATMFFDLVFVWHRYIRHSVGLQFMRKALWKPPTPKASA